MKGLGKTDRPIKSFMWIALALLLVLPLWACDDGGGYDNVDADSADTDTDTDTDECYSPFQNYQNAYDDDSVGCGCDSEAPDVCVPPAALICREGKWEAVEDGPCMPRSDECDSTLSDLQECMDSFLMCVGEADGSVCARNDRTQ